MKVLLTLFFVSIFNQSFSQFKERAIRPYLEAGGGITSGISRYVYTKFIDPRIGVGYVLSEKTALNANLGYAYFFRKTNKTGISFLPLAAGISHNVISKFFLEMQMGGALILDGSGGLYFLAEPGGGWRFNERHLVRTSYYGFITNGVAVGGINFAYRICF